MGVGMLIDVCGVRGEAGLGPGESALKVGKLFLVIFPAHKKLKIIGLSDIMFEGVGRESKVKVVEGGLTHTNM